MYDYLHNAWRAFIFLTAPFVFLFFVFVVLYSLVAVPNFSEPGYMTALVFWFSFLLALFFRWLWRVTEQDPTKKAAQ